MVYLVLFEALPLAGSSGGLFSGMYFQPHAPLHHEVQTLELECSRWVGVVAVGI